MKPWILCVDDEPKVLEGLELHLSLDYEVRTAVGGEAALLVLHAYKGCAVIISDMRMPHMNGAQFLSASRKVAPEATRMLLTGYSDVDAAMSAVNEGGIFRFLTKPAPPDVLRAAIDEGIKQWELLRSEKVLLEQTLHGAADALIEALEIATPSAFSRCRRIEAVSRHVATTLGLRPVWEVALAGLLVRLGWVAIPNETIETHLGGGTLSAAEAAMFDDAYRTAVRLVGRIPRLDGVAAVIGGAAQPTGGLDASTVVRAAAEYDRGCQLSGPAKTLSELETRFPSEIVGALRTWEGDADDMSIQEVGLAGLRPGMVAENHILTTGGNMLVRAGTDLTETVIQRLRNFSLSHGVKQPIKVSVPASGK